MKRRFTLITFTMACASLARAAKMDYHDPSELAAALLTLGRQSAHVQTLTIGYSSHIPEGRTSGQRYAILGVRISSGTSSSVRDDPSRNAILFECGMHPREWLATESCLKLAQYLGDNAENEASLVPTLLRAADVYIVPLTTVAGRVLDDPQHGDPEHFSRDPEAAGWRGNGDLRDSRWGTNVARNFSSGWDGAAADPGADYKGFMPFSSEEAAALRRFVQNHSITMAVVVHSNAQEINNYWDDPAGNSIDALARWAWNGGLDDQALTLTETGRGTGIGQFTAWLAARSNAAGQPDLDTLRGIRTVLIELPITSANYRTPYRNRDGDDSNGFHPSGDRVLNLIGGSFIPMAKILIAYAGSPGCLALKQCPAADFGFAGAKIGQGLVAAGALETQPAYKTVIRGVETAMPARDYLPVGRYCVYYRVQNFVNVAADADVEITIDDGIVAPQRTLRRYSLDRLAGAADSVAFDVAGQSTDYTVTLRVRPANGFTTGATDNFSENNKKVFKFRSYQLN